MLPLVIILLSVIYTHVRAMKKPAPTIPRADGLHFNFDGERRYFAGTNSYWLPFLKNNSDVDLVLDHMAEAQLRILRIWGFNDVKDDPKDGMTFHH
jgi:mannan endo-1,4-beta-mannosidase